MFGNAVSLFCLQILHMAADVNTFDEGRLFITLISRTKTHIFCKTYFSEGSIAQWPSFQLTLLERELLRIFRSRPANLIHFHSFQTQSWLKTWKASPANKLCDLCTWKTKIKPKSTRSAMTNLSGNIKHG